eukprot:PhM_4_TR1260/c0_g1_i1/m.31683
MCNKSHVKPICCDKPLIVLHSLPRLTFFWVFFDQTVEVLRTGGLYINDARSFATFLIIAYDWYKRRERRRRVKQHVKPSHHCFHLVRKVLTFTLNDNVRTANENKLNNDRCRGAEVHRGADFGPAARHMGELAANDSNVCTVWKQSRNKDGRVVRGDSVALHREGRRAAVVLHAVVVADGHGKAQLEEPLDCEFVRGVLGKVRLLGVFLHLPVPHEGHLALANVFDFDHKLWQCPDDKRNGKLGGLRVLRLSAAHSEAVSRVWPHTASFELHHPAGGLNIKHKDAGLNRVVFVKVDVVCVVCAEGDGRERTVCLVPFHWGRCVHKRAVVLCAVNALADAGRRRFEDER